MTIEDLKKKNLPDVPGVYFFKKGRQILYIGKATSLQSRVRSYFSNDILQTRGPAILDMTTQATAVTFTETDSVLEALILESTLIKKNQPKYNVKERDNKSFNNVIITDEKFPRVLLVRDRVLKEGRFDAKIKKQYGPFPSTGQLKEALKLIQKIFPHFNTSKEVDKMSDADIKRVGLNVQLGLYPDTFSGKITQKEYLKTIRHIGMFFEGKKDAVIKRLEKQMEVFSKEQEFEKASGVKKTIFALNHINDINLLKENEQIREESGFRMESYDIAHTAGTDTVGAMVVMIDGELRKEEYKKFIIRDAKKSDDYGALREVLTRRLNHPEWTMPNLIVIDGGKGQKSVAEKVLETAGVDIPIVSVVKDDRHKAREILGNVTDVQKKDIIRLNEETHRFAITFHRKRRGVIK